MSKTSLAAVLLFVGCLLAPTLAIDKMFSAGVNLNGILGIGDNSASTQRDVPTVVAAIEDSSDPPDSLLDVFCCDGYHLVLDSNNKVWGWGLDNTGSMGGVSPNDPTVLDLTGPNYSEEKIVKIGGILSGTTFWVTVDDSNVHRLYCSGTSYGDQCENPGTVIDTSGETGPISTIDGYFSNALITREGSNGIWQVGIYNSDGRLGNGGTEFDSGYSVMTRNPMWDTVTSGKLLEFARAGQHNTYVKLTNGEFWVSGGQLAAGMGEVDGEELIVPTRMTSVPANWVDLSATDHVLALDDTGAVWSWGKGGSGQLGHADTLDRLEPTLISYFTNSALNVTAISTSETASLAVDASGFLYTWGANGNGHLGLGPPPTSGTSNVLVPTKVTYFPDINLSVTSKSCLSSPSMFVFSSSEPPQTNLFDEVGALVILGTAFGGILFALFALNSFCSQIDNAIMDSQLPDEEE